MSSNSMSIPPHSQLHTSYSQYGPAVPMGTSQPTNRGGALSSVTGGSIDTASSSGGAATGSPSTTSTQVEDCRDYLRTGRCKYGASCKYNHPPNVQSGGGMKTPIDPSEPMFPIRPSEPVCQYYMKHGTCKFGQACKFHHPPNTGSSHSNNSNNTTSQSPLQLVNGVSGPMLVNVLKDDRAAPQLILSPVGTADAQTGSVMLQFLPQRPDEPDCIFFLKNGRCKYGATCRYHHPINYYPQTQQQQQRRPVQIADDSRRQQQHKQQQQHQQQTRSLAQKSVQDSYISSGQQTQNLQYMAPSIAATGSYSQHGGHLFVSDGPMTFLNLDGSSTSAHGGYQLVSTATHDMNGLQYCAPVGSGTVTEQGSSTSSIASSSYDTASSNLEHLAMVQQGDTPALFYRGRRNGSGNSLISYGVDHGRVQQQQQQTSNTQRGIQQSASDGSIASRQQRHRAASYGSSSDHSVYYDAVTLPGTSQGMIRNSSVGSWRQQQQQQQQVQQLQQQQQQQNDRTLQQAYEQNQALRVIPANTQYQAGNAVSNQRTMQSQNLDPSDSSRNSPYMGRPIPPGFPNHPGLRRGNTRRSPRQGEQLHGAGQDEGFTMMTSALLNMLDTPEEASAESFSDDEFGRYMPPQRPSYLPSQVGSSGPSRMTDQHVNHHPMDHALFEQLSLNSPPHAGSLQQQPQSTLYNNQDSRDPQSWSPTWQGSSINPNQRQPHLSSMGAISQVMSAYKQPRHGQHHPGQSTSPHPSSDVGLYIP